MILLVVRLVGQMELDSEAFRSSRTGVVIPVHRNLSAVSATNTNHIKSPSEGRTGYSTFIAKKMPPQMVVKQKPFNSTPQTRNQHRRICVLQETAGEQGQENAIAENVACIWPNPKFKVTTSNPHHLFMVVHLKKLDSNIFK